MQVMKGLAGSRPQNQTVPHLLLNDIRDRGHARIVQQMLQDLVADASSFQEDVSGTACPP